MAELHENWMREALSLAVHGEGWVSPNPMVGAVVVRDGVVVGRGWHERFGGPHAEVHALRNAGTATRGATLYCTLEPCNHTGKTPPCVQAVIGAGITTVVLGARDPNPVAAGGIVALRAAGVQVIEGICATECRRSNAAFFKCVSTRVPLIALKWAMSLDGKIATGSGDSKWITGEMSRLHARRLRGRHDAVVVGIGTVLADDPSFNVRLDSDEETASTRQPRRVILDSNARTPLNSKLFDVQPAGPIILTVCKSPNASVMERIDALRERGAEVVEVDPSANGSVSVEAVVRELGKRGVMSVLVEGGAQVLGAFVDAKLADRAHVFVAPKIVGGGNGLSAVGGRGVEKVADAMTFIDGSVTSQMIGNDMLIEGAFTEWGWSAHA
ncbi:MAG: bifunctional diaminohydroxyphosphoribosylaminopyrimidine deaminase/5-amino-6-(5-phosphoribosylamino)uracil reductase RibD [Planctomycetota bacterium]